ncbi:MAG: PAS domain S-box protein, partial [Planctomycetota bacterium]
MNGPSEEEEQLQSTAFQNVKSILQARRRAEDELVQAKQALELRASELAQSVATMRATLESTTDAILVTGPTGRPVDHNDKFLRTWGLSRSQLIQMNRKELWLALATQVAEAEPFVSRLAKVEDSTSESFDQLEFLDGRVIERVSRALTVDGSLVGRVWSFRDITGRREYEVALRSSHAQFSAIIQHSPIGILLADFELVLREVNPAALPMLGGQGDFIGRDLSEALDSLWPTADASEVLERFRETLRSGEPYVCRSFATRRPGRPVEDHFDWELHRLILPDGRHGVVCYLIDISDHVRAQAALRSSEQRVRATFEQAALGMVVADLDGRFLDVNRKFAQMLGFTPEELA